MTDVKEHSQTIYEPPSQTREQRERCRDNPLVCLRRQGGRAKADRTKTKRG